MKKHIGFIGLGKMGENMVLHLLERGYKVTVYNRDSSKTKKIAKHRNIIPSFSYEEFAKKTPKPRTIIIMVTAGKPVDSVINELSKVWSKGDTIIEGGNSRYEDSIKQSELLEKRGIHFLDMGTSGGLTGARHGASLMIGGDKKIFKKHEQLFKDLAVKNGYAYLGDSGAGHFVKTIHNGIEYAILEAYGEGYEILKKSKYNLDLREVSKVWANGSVIRSWITELAESAFKKSKSLKDFKGKIGGGETGSWALKIAENEKVEADTLRHALGKRKKSKKEQSFSTKFISAIRNEFGGHDEP